jgi:hypothetical protein
LKTIAALIPIYEQQVAEQFDWKKVKATAIANAHEEHSGDEVVEQEGAEGLCYLGSILHLCPSGKFYMPWACSNVMGCQACGGTGKVARKLRSRHRRVKKYRRLCRMDERLSHQGRKIGYFVDWPPGIKRRVRDVRARIEAFATDKTCPYCGGSGSREAAMDEMWREALEAEASKHGMYITGSEGDGCDIMAGISVVVGEPAVG